MQNELKGRLCRYRNTKYNVKPQALHVHTLCTCFCYRLAWTNETELKRGEFHVRTGQRVEGLYTYAGE